MASNIEQIRATLDSVPVGGRVRVTVKGDGIDTSHDWKRYTHHFHKIGENERIRHTVNGFVGWANSIIKAGWHITVEVIHDN